MRYGDLTTTELLTVTCRFIGTGAVHKEPPEQAVFCLCFIHSASVPFLSFLLLLNHNPTSHYGAELT